MKRLIFRAGVEQEQALRRQQSRRLMTSLLTPAGVTSLVTTTMTHNDT